MVQLLVLTRKKGEWGEWDSLDLTDLKWREHKQGLILGWSGIQKGSSSFMVLAPPRPAPAPTHGNAAPQDRDLSSAICPRMPHRPRRTTKIRTSSLQNCWVCWVSGPTAADQRRGPLQRTPLVPSVPPESRASSLLHWQRWARTLSSATNVIVRRGGGWFNARIAYKEPHSDMTELHPAPPTIILAVNCPLFPPFSLSPVSFHINKDLHRRLRQQRLWSFSPFSPTSLVFAVCSPCLPCPFADCHCLTVDGNP